jgi:hypothetical protein
MAKWRPIKTAPKSGRKILLWCEFDEPEIVIGSYTRNAPSGPHGRFCWMQANEGGSIAANVVTKWQPLPSPPASA